MAMAYPAAVDAVRVVTPGVAYVRGRAEVQEQRAARTRLGLPQSGRCILFVGNDYRKKGLPALVAAVTQLPADCYLAVVGNAAQIPGFQAELDTSGNRGRVIFLGALRSVDDAYRAADCLAHPTLEDTFAMVVLEAMAHGLPVVVSSARYCGIAEHLTHESDALVLDDPRDSKALADALKRVLTDAPLVHRLMETGLRFARQHLWSEKALQQEAIYYSVAARD
jgi:glycosyltransferase involved in cell wall biosynthesis